MGDAMKDTDNQFLTPTLSAPWLAREMVRIIESGLSDHLVTPHFAHALLPNLRSAPDYFRWLVATVRVFPPFVQVEGTELMERLVGIGRSARRTRPSRCAPLSSGGLYHALTLSTPHQDARNAVQMKTYRLVEELDKKHLGQGEAK